MYCYLCLILQLRSSSVNVWVYTVIYRLGSLRVDRHRGQMKEESSFFIRIAKENAKYFMHGHKIRDGHVLIQDSLEPF